MESSFNRAAKVLPAGVQLPAADLDHISHLYERGFMLQAYAVAQKYGPLAQWMGTAARIMAGRLANNLGAPRLARHLPLWTHLRDPENPEARFYYGFVVLEMRGPLAAWAALERFGEMPEAAPRVRADLFALRAHTAAMVRDFDTAESWLRRAEALTPESAWTRVERAFLFEQQDRYADAYAAAGEAMRAHPHPFYRPAVQTAAHLLELLDRDTEAVELLMAASAAIESGPVAAQLAMLQAELGQFAEANAGLDRYASLCPLMEEEVAGWVAAQRAKWLCFCGEREAAAAVAATLQDAFHQRFAQEILDPNASQKRVILPVRFVRQHYKTCAPATLATLGRFWGMPSDHQEVAEAICYDGTPGAKQREWAETHGWIVREFRVTWESAIALLDRGVPFTVSTVETRSAHLQAVIGYDSLRRSLWIRDPYQRHAGEVLSEPFLERYRCTGPTAMALVPSSRRELLDGLDLPDSALYDEIYRLQRALSRHQREEAQAAVSELLARAPAHPLCWQARRELAEYDSNSTESLACIEGLLALFPADANLRLAKLAALNNARREDRVSLLHSICSAKVVDPLFWQQYARELSGDARARPQAQRLLRRSLRFRPVDSGSFTLLADLLWQGRHFSEALDLYRFAACFEDKSEQAARTYFIAARHLRQTEGALTQFQTRFQRLGRLSAGPATTLVWAYQALHRSADAFACLERALVLRAEDGELLCFAADEYARWGKVDRAEALLAAAEGKCHRSLWLRAAAQIAQYRSESARSLELWRQILELEPLSLQVHREVARLTAATVGRPAALRHLEQTCERFPNHFGLHQLWLEWLRAEPAEAAQVALERLLAINPADAWARREWAGWLSRQKRFDDALAQANSAVEIDPQNPASYLVRGQIEVQAGQREAARADFRGAIELAVDNDFAIRRLVELGDTHTQRQEALQFVEQELIRQVVFGDGLLTFREVAHPVLPPEELLNSLRLALKERPDLWHAWAALVQQLTDLGQLDEALLRAHEATARFPLVPRLWLELARVHFARSNRADEMIALEKALEISPGWSVAARKLGEAMVHEGDLSRCREILEQAVARDPLDEYNHGSVANLLWKLGDRPAALSHVQAALRLNGSYDWAWTALAQWGKESNDPDLAVAAARDLTIERAGEPNSWFRFARALQGPDHFEERLAAVNRALDLQPQWIGAHVLRAEILAGAGKFDEALASCSGLEWAGSIPVQLRSTAASIHAWRGNFPEAIRLIREALKSDADYYPGWSQLADWCLRNGQLEGAAAAVTEMVRLAPLNPVPHASLGDLKLRQNQRIKAKQHFRRALELNREYAHAGMVLFDLHLEDNELAEAAATLAALRLAPGNPYYLARELQLAARQGDEERSLNLLAQLCTAKDAAPWPLQAAVHAAVQAGWSVQVDKCLEQWLESPEANPYLGAAWVVRRTTEGRWGIWKQLESLCTRGVIGQEAVLQFLDSLGKAALDARRRNAHFQLIRYRWIFTKFLRQHRHRLETDDAAWGKVGYALVNLGKQKKAIDWLGTWKRHPKVEMWMVYNLVLALRGERQNQAAAAVVRDALRLPVRDHTFGALVVWAALDEALAGNTVAARDVLTSVEQLKLADEQQVTVALTRAVLDVQEAAPMERAGVARQSVAAAQAAWNSKPTAKTKALLRTYRR